jgi:hypothetical protein
MLRRATGVAFENLTIFVSWVPSANRVRELVVAAFSSGAPVTCKGVLRKEGSISSAKFASVAFAEAIELAIPPRRFLGHSSIEFLCPSVVLIDGLK